MAYPNHWLLALGGQFTGGDEGGEIWQCGIRGLPAAGSSYTLADAAAALGDLQDALGTWFSDSASYMRNDANLEYVKLNEIGPDGRYVDPTTNEHRYSSPPVGAALAYHPPILSLCFSFGTARARGIGSHGRIYPPYAVPAGSGIRIGSVDQGRALTAAQALLHTISNPSSGTFVMTPCVVSKGNKTGTQAGVAEQITTVRIGDVIDVQRRRKDALKETYVAASGPPW